jgi:lysozyme
MSDLRFDVLNFAGRAEISDPHELDRLKAEPHALWCVIAAGISASDNGAVDVDGEQKLERLAVCLCEFFRFIAVEKLDDRRVRFDVGAGVQNRQQDSFLSRRDDRKRGVRISEYALLRFDIPKESRAAGRLILRRENAEDGEQRNDKSHTPDFMLYKLSAAGIDLIKRFEGLRLTSYQDSVGVWTIGYGSTLGVHAGLSITQAQADSRLLSDLQNAVDCVNRKVGPALSDNQFAAMVSFVFNLGCAAFSGSTLLRLLNAGEDAAAANEFLRWDHAGGQVLEGLLRRRQAERDLFLLT